MPATPCKASWPNPKPSRLPSDCRVRPATCVASRQRLRVAASRRPCCAMSVAKFKTASLIVRARFVAVTRKAHGIAKAYMTNQFAERGPHRKTVVDWATLKYIDDGFEIRFKEPLKFMNAYAWFARSLGKELADKGVQKTDFNFDLFGPEAPLTGTDSDTAASAGMGVQASVAPNPKSVVPGASVAGKAPPQEASLPLWAPSCPALKLARSPEPRPGEADRLLYPLLRKLGEGTFGIVYGSNREGTELAVKAFRNQKDGWGFAVEDV